MRKILVFFFLVLVPSICSAGFGGYLKADTATSALIGPFVDKTDGLTPETGITLGGADEAELIKHGATTVVDISAAGWIAFTSCDGYYSLSITAAHTDTEGRLTVVVQDDSVCLPVRVDFMVQNANVFDSLHAAAATDYLQTDTIQVSGTSQTANDNGADINAILLDTGTDGVLIAAAEPVAISVAAILVDTAAIQPKLPTNYIMGSSDQTDKDDDIDAILTDTGTTGVLIAAADPVAVSMAAALADTNEMQTDWTDGGRLDLILDELTTQGDTNESKLDTIDDFLDTEIAELMAESDAEAITINAIKVKVDRIRP